MILIFFLFYFSYVDFVDSYGMIFVFFVVEYGFLDNLVFIMRKGVNVNYKMKLFILFDFNYGYGFVDVVFELKFKFRSFIMFYVVVYGGYLNVVYFFFSKGVFILILNDVY